MVGLQVIMPILSAFRGRGFDGAFVVTTVRRAVLVAFALSCALPLAAWIKPLL